MSNAGQIVLGVVGAVVGGVIGFYAGGPGGAVYGASFGAGLGFGVGVYAFPYRPDTSAPGQVQSDLTISTSQEGVPIADVLGTVKLTGNILGYWGNRSTEIMSEEGGKGGGGSSAQVLGYSWYLSWAMGICKGPIDTLYAIYREEKCIWSGELNRFGDMSTIVIEGMGSIDFYFGTESQTQNAAMGALLDDPTLNTPYRGLCYAFFNDCYIGDYNRAPTIRFVLRKSPVLAFSTNRMIGDLDYNGIHAAYYVLTSMVGLPITYLNDDSFAAAALTVKNEGHGMGSLFDKQIAARTYLETILGHIDAVMRYGIDGKFHIFLLRTDVAIADLPEVTDENMLEDMTLQRKAWSETINELKVQFMRRIITTEDDETGAGGGSGGSGGGGPCSDYAPVALTAGGLEEGVGEWGVPIEIKVTGGSGPFRWEGPPPTESLSFTSDPRTVVFTPPDALNPCVGCPEWHYAVIVKDRCGFDVVEIVYPAVEPTVPVITYTTLQMSTNEVQGLSVENPVDGATYVWSLSGPGSLSSSTGVSTAYTAPASNPGCQPATITVTCVGGASDSVTIAVNAYTDLSVGAFYNHISWLCTTFTGIPMCNDYHRVYNCLGERIGIIYEGGYVTYHSCWTPLLGCLCQAIPSCTCGEQGTEGNCGTYFTPTYVMYDNRSEEMKAAGCCPLALL